MGEKYHSNTPNCDNEIKDAVCVHTDKVYDSCKDKDCIEDARVFLTACGQEIIDKAVNIKCRKAEIIWVFPDVEACSVQPGLLHGRSEVLLQNHARCVSWSREADTGGRPCVV